MTERQQQRPSKYSVDVNLLYFSRCLWSFSFRVVCGAWVFELLIALLRNTFLCQTSCLSCLSYDSTWLIWQAHIKTSFKSLHDIIIHNSVKSKIIIPGSFNSKTFDIYFQAFCKFTMKVTRLIDLIWSFQLQNKLVYSLNCKVKESNLMRSRKVMVLKSIKKLFRGGGRNNFFQKKLKP